MFKNRCNDEYPSTVVDFLSTTNEGHTLVDTNRESIKEQNRKVRGHTDGQSTCDTS